MALKLGLNLGYWGIGPQGDEAVEIVQAAEQAGFDSVWVAESYGSDVVSVLAWLAAQTETIKLGARDHAGAGARRPPPPRWPACTIDALSGGRFIFGFGPSGPQVSEGWYGVALRRSRGAAPASTSRSCARSSPARGRSSTTASTTSCRSEGGHRPGQGAEAQLPSGPQRDPDLRRRDRPQVGRDGSRDLRRLDPDLLQRRRLRGGLGRAPRGGLREGRAHARGPRGLALGPGRDRRRPRRRPRRGQGRASCSTSAAWARRRRTSTSTSPAASASSEVADEVQALFLDGKRDKAYEAIPDELVDATSMIGTEDEVAERIEAFAKGGVDRLIVSPVHMDPEQRMHTIERLARDRRRGSPRLSPPWRAISGAVLHRLPPREDRSTQRDRRGRGRVALVPDVVKALPRREHRGRGRARRGRGRAPSRRRQYTDAGAEHRRPLGRRRRRQGRAAERGRGLQADAGPGR